MKILNKEIKTVAVDFDGTLFEEKYPEIGAPIMRMINYIKYLKSLGIELILWTNRGGSLLQDAVNICKEYGIVFDAVNENLEWRTKLYGNDSRKVGADLYIDDKSINPLLDMDMLDKLIEGV